MTAAASVRRLASDSRWLGRTSALAYVWAVGGVGVATCGFWLARAHVPKGQASLLYLPVVIACAVRFGFGPAVVCAVLSFLCWNFFFLPPAFTLFVHDKQDWLSLVVFLVAAITTAQLASRARDEATSARAREAEIALLFETSEAISQEVSARRLLAALASQCQALCRASRCVVLRRAAGGNGLVAVDDAESSRSDNDAQLARDAERAFTNADAGPSDAGIFVPLHAARPLEGDGEPSSALVGVLYVGPRVDGEPFSPIERRLIQTLANHAATVIAREELAEQAAQATALREADTLKDALLSLVSHELRTPLAAIKASASGLLQPDSRWDERSRREALVAIDHEADRLSGLVNHLLDLSRLEAGAWKPALDWCDLGEIIATVLDRLPDETVARVAVRIDPDLPLVRADYIQIALVLQNLLENAAKYAPGPGTIDIIVSLANDRNSISVSVRDYGGGITPGEETQLFSRFFRGRQHRDGPIHGTGLGLALCDAIIRAHGGKITAANASPGAIFNFELPLCEGTGDRQQVTGDTLQKTGIDHRPAPPLPLSSRAAT